MRAAMDTLFVRLTALEAMVMQKPIITGRYSESPYINFMKPIEARFHGSCLHKESSDSGDLTSMFSGNIHEKLSTVMCRRFFTKPLAIPILMSPNS